MYRVNDFKRNEGKRITNKHTEKKKFNYVRKLKLCNKAEEITTHEKELYL